MTMGRLGSHHAKEEKRTCFSTFAFRSKNMKSDSVHKILFCLRYGIGDLIMEMPAIELLRRTFPEARIDAVGARPATELLEGTSLCDELFHIQDWGLEHWGDSGTPEIKDKIREWLKQRNHDLIFDPSHAVVGLRDVIRELDTPVLDTPNHRFEVSDEKGGVAVIREAVLEGWGLEVPHDAKPKIRLSRAEMEESKRYLQRFLNRHSGLAISIVASSPLKCWPMENFAALADGLIEQTGAEVLVIYGPQRQELECLLDRMRHPDRALTIGSVHLRLIAGLLAHCSVLICNDTGLMHLAAAVGTASVAVFGPTYHKIYLPPGSSMAVFGNDGECPFRLTDFFSHPDCVIAGRCLTGPESCINDVKLDRVMHAVRCVLFS
jgi:ADP-heptose:LPS heptosyltransferase